MTAYYTKQHKKRSNLQNFHTRVVKKSIIEKTTLLVEHKFNDIHYLDFGSGKGGDLPRVYELSDKHKLSRYLGMEKDSEGIKESIRRFGRSKYKHLKFSFCNFDLNQNIIEKGVLKEKHTFNLISSQFVIHYFLKSEQSIRAYLQNVSDNLMTGGMFVFTTFDAVNVLNMFKRNGNNKIVSCKKDDNVMWSIEKKFDKLRTPYGNEIEVYVDSIGRKHSEYLVDTSNLTKLAKEYNLKLRDCNRFSKFYNDKYNLENYEKDFSFLSVYYIFEKI